MGMSARIMPRDRSAAALDVVIAVMAFLAALALGASLIADRAAASWRTGLAGRITVQILPPQNSRATLDAQIEAALSVLRSTPGIAHTSLVSEQDTLALVRPWLGADALVGDLPLPRLIDAAVTPGAALDIESLRQRLKAAAPDSVVDDHSRWLARLRGLAQGIVWSAYGVLLLIALATAATVSFATRAGLEAHHEIVALLHQMGARTGFIARAFEWHYFLAALIAGAIGAGAAAALFAASGALESVGVEAVPFLPPIGLHASEMMWLFAVPAAASMIALATARISVLGVLRRID
jgi:cell division transport system permease protein